MARLIGAIKRSMKLVSSYFVDVARFNADHAIHVVSGAAKSSTQ